MRLLNVSICHGAAASKQLVKRDQPFTTANQATPAALRPSRVSAMGKLHRSSDTGLADESKATALAAAAFAAAGANGG